MGDVTFSEEPQYQVPTSYGPSSSRSFLLSLPIKLGLARNEAGATKVLVITAVSCVVLAGAAWFMLGTNSTKITQKQYLLYAQHAVIPPQ